MELLDYNLVEKYAKGIHNIYSRWTSKAIQMPCAIALHFLLNVMPNWWEEKKKCVAKLKAQGPTHELM